MWVSQVQQGPDTSFWTGLWVFLHLRALTWQPIRNEAPVVPLPLRSSVLLGLFTNSLRPLLLQVSSEYNSSISTKVGHYSHYGGGAEGRTWPLGHLRSKISCRHMTADLELLCLLPVLAGHPNSVQTLIADFRGLWSTPVSGHPFSLTWEAAQIPTLIILPTHACWAGLLSMRYLMNDAAWMCPFNVVQEQLDLKKGA